MLMLVLPMMMIELIMLMLMIMIVIVMMIKMTMMMIKNLRRILLGEMPSTSDSFLTSWQNWTFTKVV